MRQLLKSMLHFWCRIIFVLFFILNAEALEMSTVKNALSQSPPAQIFKQTLDLPLDILCSSQTLQKCNFAKSATLIDFKLQLCQQNNQSSACQDFVKRYPEFKGKIPKCNMTEFCEQHLASSKDFLNGCFYGFWDENAENLKMMKEALIKFYESENLASKAYEAIKSKIANMSVDPVQMTMSLFSSAEKMLTDKGLQMQCLDEKTKAEMICRTATLIVDPAIILKSAKLGDELSKMVLGLTKDKLKKETREKILKGHFVKFGMMAGELKDIAVASGAKIVKYRNGLGEEFLVYEKTVKDKAGKELKISREINIDPLTKAIDVRSPGGQSYLDDLLADASKKGVKKGLIFFDIENLGFVNKNFLSGSAAGDAYLKSMTDVIKKEFAGKGQLVKFGGDEYGIIFDGLSDAEVKTALLNIQKKILDPENRKVFTDEKMYRSDLTGLRNEEIRAQNPGLSDAELLKLQKESAKELQEFAKFSQSGISMGSSFATPGETTRAILDRAEAQAQKMKLQNKSDKNIDSTKYGEGGKPVDPNKRANFYSRATVESPAAGGTPTSNVNAAKLVEPTEPQVVHRLGEMNVEESINPLGDKVYYYHQFFDAADGQRLYASREVFVNANTGFFDATHISGEAVMEAALKNGGVKALKSRHVVEVDAKSLGVANYFGDLTEAGNILLKETAKVIEDVVQKNGIPFKKEGSRFQVVLDGLSDAQVQKIEHELAQKLKNSPALKALFENEKKRLQAQGQTVSQKIQEGAKFSVASVKVSEKDTVKSVSATLRKKTAD